MNYNNRDLDPRKCGIILFLLAIVATLLFWMVTGTMIVDTITKTKNWQEKDCLMNARDSIVKNSFFGYAWAEIYTNTTQGQPVVLKFPPTPGLAYLVRKNEQEANSWKAAHTGSVSSYTCFVRDDSIGSDAISSHLSGEWKWWLYVVGAYLFAMAVVCLICKTLYEA